MLADSISKHTTDSKRAKYLNEMSFTQPRIILLAHVHTMPDSRFHAYDYLLQRSMSRTGLSLACLHYAYRCERNGYMLGRNETKEEGGGCCGDVQASKYTNVSEIISKSKYKFKS